MLPFCDGLQVCCCVTQQTALPPIPGSPLCVCFNKKLAGADSTGNWAPRLFDYTSNFDDTFWIYYLFCGGLGVSGIQANNRPLYGVMNKELCIKQAVRLVPPVEDGILCSGVGTALCFWDQLELPPPKGTPGFKCFGFPKKEGMSSNVAPMSYGKPGQDEMK